MENEEEKVEVVEKGESPKQQASTSYKQQAGTSQAVSTEVQSCSNWQQLERKPVLVKIQVRI